ncbi:hypothetical protein ACLOJK_026469 [Asimina triloba]
MVLHLPHGATIQPKSRNPSHRATLLSTGSEQIKRAPGSRGTPLAPGLDDEQRGSCTVMANPTIDGSDGIFQIWSMEDPLASTAPASNARACSHRSTEVRSPNDSE